MREYFIAFLAGGTVTSLIMFFELSGYPTLSRLAALFPVFTWISYLFIGKLESAQAVSDHALFVLLGTLIAWVPYMLAIHFLAPKLGAVKAVGVAIAVFIVLALIFVLLHRS